MMESSETNANGFVLPVCWKDDVRMRALFAEFRPKEANPEGWQDKMDFWVSLILQWSRETRTPVFSASDVAVAFERKRSQPACLRTVLSHMKKSGDLINSKDYFTSEGWVKWGFDTLVKRPLTWMWTWGSGSGEADTEIDEMLVNVDVLRQLQQEVITRCEEERFVEDVVPYSEVWKVCEGICKDQRSFAYVLNGLEKSRYVRLFQRDGKKVVQFLRHNNTLSEQEKAMLKLEKAKQDLNQKVDLLQNDIDRCTREALEAKKQGLQNKALHILKKRRRAQQALDKQFGMLDNIHSLEMNIHENKDIQLIYDGYKTAAQALKVAHGGLEADNVDDVVAEINTTLEDQQELHRLMGATIGGDAEIDELEAELNEIMMEESGTNEGQDVSQVSDVDKGLEFPAVPTEAPHSPAKPSVAELRPQPAAWNAQ
uniref:CHMP7 winged helix domain-containing protein n=2 Tax=Amblyomma TaxID=6942 RepID=G3MT65_AMBMU